MDTWLFIGYELVATLGPLMVIYLVKYKRDKSWLSLLIFSVYLMMVFNVTGAGTLYDIFLYGIKWNGEQVNLIPFSQGVSLVEYGLNIVMLMPFGLLAAALFTDNTSIYPVMKNGCLLILIVELSQLLNNRRTDVDDLIMNSLGLFVGFLLYKLVSKKLKTNPIPNIQLPISSVIWITFISRFFLFNDFGLAKWLYGF